VDIRVVLPDDTEHRERRKAPVSSKSAAQRWGDAREREWFHQLTHPQPTVQPKKVVPTLTEFAPRFLKGHAHADQQKASGVHAKEVILRVHLQPALGDKRLDAIGTEDVQRLKSQLKGKAPKTVNNVLTVLNTLLKKAVEWGVIDEVRCRIKLLKVSKGSVSFYGFDEYERLVAAAKAIDIRSHLLVLLSGEAGLRSGEMVALEWTDLDLTKRLICVQRNVWEGQVDSTKGGRLRYVPMTARLAAALRDARHLRGPRVLYRDNGRPYTEGAVGWAIVRAAARGVGGQRAAPASALVLFASRDARGGAASDSGAGRSRPRDHHAAVHALESRCDRECDPVAGAARFREISWRHCGDGGG
jgi:integrase